MRTTHPRPPATSVFTSKLFVVALCAAIAMVLGAMSVGSNTPSVHEDPVVTAPSSMANRAGMFGQSGSTGGQNQVETTKPLSPSYFQHQTPVPLSPADPNGGLPITNSPVKNLEIKLNLKSFEASISTPATVLLLETGSPLLGAAVPDVSVDVSTGADQTLQDASTLTGDTLSQAVEPLVDNTAETPTE